MLELIDISQGTTVLLVTFTAHFKKVTINQLIVQIAHTFAFINKQLSLLLKLHSSAMFLLSKMCILLLDARQDALVLPAHLKLVL